MGQFFHTFDACYELKLRKPIALGKGISELHPHNRGQNMTHKYSNINKYHDIHAKK